MHRVSDGSRVPQEAVIDPNAQDGRTFSSIYLASGVGTVPKAVAQRPSGAVEGPTAAGGDAQWFPKTSVLMPATFHC
jgi:hypothetical protein